MIAFAWSVGVRRSFWVAVFAAAGVLDVECAAAGRGCGVDVDAKGEEGAGEGSRVKSAVGRLEEDR